MAEEKKKNLQEKAKNFVESFIKGFKGGDIGTSTMYERLKDKLAENNELKGVLGDFELQQLLQTIPRPLKKSKKEEKPRKNPIGAELVYAKKGGMVTKSKPKVAGRLAKRGYGKAMKKK